MNNWKHALLLWLFFVACSNQERLEESKSVFYYNESAGITSLDPAFANNQENIWWVNQIFDGLVEMDDEMRVVPLIAKKWEIDSTSTQYRFHLRTDVYFHEDSCFGEKKTRKVQASDFVYSFNRIINREVATPGAWIFANLKDENPVIAINDSLLEINLKSPFAPFLSILSMQYCAVVAKEAVDFYKSDFSRNPVGCGPFRFNFWLENNVLALLKNEGYFLRDEQGQNLPYLDAIKVNFVRDKSVMFLDFLKGEYDMISSLHPSYKDELLTLQGDLKSTYTDRFYLQKQDYLKTDYLGFFLDDSISNTNSFALQNKLVRQAMNLAINRKDMVLFIKNNTSKSAELGFTPPAIVNKANSILEYSYDPTKARALLQEAGYPNAEGIGEIELATTQDYVDLCEFVQSELRKIGIKVKIEVMPTANHRNDVRNGKSMFFRKSWIADYAEAENFLSLFYSPNFAPNGSNYTHFKNVEFDRLYEMAMVSGNVFEREVLYSKMDSIISEEAPVIPLFYDEVIRFVRKDISGLNSNAMNLLDLKRVRKL